MFLQFTKNRDYVMTNNGELTYKIVFVHIVLAQYDIIKSQNNKHLLESNFMELTYHLEYD